MLTKDYDKYMLHNLIIALIVFDATVSLLKVSGSSWLVIWFQISTLVSTQHPEWSLKLANQTLNYLAWNCPQGLSEKSTDCTKYLFFFWSLLKKNFFFFQNLSTVFLKSLTVLTKKDKKKDETKHVDNKW